MLEEKLPLFPKDAKSLLIYPLYATLPPEQQLTVFTPTPPDSRKVILSTNIAESSVTIQGIKYVVDSGMIKIRVSQTTTGLESLLVTPVSKSHAWQRSGRAGRESAGKVEFADRWDAVLSIVSRRRVSRSSWRRRSRNPAMQFEQHDSPGMSRMIQWNVAENDGDWGRLGVSLSASSFAWFAQTIVGAAASVGSFGSTLCNGEMWFGFRDRWPNWEEKWRCFRWIRYTPVCWFWAKNTTARLR